MCRITDRSSSLARLLRHPGRWIVVGKPTLYNPSIERISIEYRRMAELGSPPPPDSDNSGSIESNIDSSFKKSEDSTGGGHCLIRGPGTISDSSNSLEAQVDAQNRCQYGTRPKDQTPKRGRKYYKMPVPTDQVPHLPADDSYAQEIYTESLATRIHRMKTFTASSVLDKLAAQNITFEQALYMRDHILADGTHIYQQEYPGTGQYVMPLPPNMYHPNMYHPSMYMYPVPIPQYYPVAMMNEGQEIPHNGTPYTNYYPNELIYQEPEGTMVESLTHDANMVD